MSTEGVISSVLIFFYFLLAPNLVSAHVRPPSCRRVDAIYSLGDSIADTGNLIREGASGAFSAIEKLPYGESISKATGRCSDGLLMIDYLALSLGLPLLPPYLNKDADFSHGANFAVAGATALNQTFFQAKGVVLPYTNSSLDVQLGWLKSYLNSICSSKAVCAEKLKHSLVLVGEIGGNDYNYIFLQGKSVQDVVSSVPVVVQTIIDAAKELIEAGVHQIIVPGNFPIGCMPVYLTAFQSTDPKDYDHNNCLIQLNNLALLHNEALQKALKVLRQEYPHVVILYADYFQAFTHLINNAVYFGFKEKSLLKACCGAGGNYNFDSTRLCGAPDTSVCKYPSNHISWDGIHLTQAAYKIIAAELINGGFTYPSCGVITSYSYI